MPFHCEFLRKERYFTSDELVGFDLFKLAVLGVNGTTSHGFHLERGEHSVPKLFFVHIFHLSARNVFEFEILMHSAGQVNQRIDYLAAYQIRVTFIQLGIGFLEQRTEHFVRVFQIATINESIVLRGQFVINNHFDPFAIMPESESKYAGIVLSEALISGHY